MISKKIKPMEDPIIVLNPPKKNMVKAKAKKKKK